MQGDRSKKTTLKGPTAHTKPKMTLNAIMGDDEVEAPFTRRTDKRGIDLLYDINMIELKMSLRCQAFKVPTCRLGVEDEHLRNMLDHEFGCSDQHQDDAEIRVDMMFDYNDNEYEIVRVFQYKVIAKGIVDGIEIEFADLEFIFNACNEKLE